MHFNIWTNLCISLFYLYNKTILELIKIKHLLKNWCFCLSACHERHRSMNIQMWYFIVKIFILQSQGYFKYKYIRWSDDKTKVHFNLFERQTPSKLLHGKITDWVIIKIQLVCSLVDAILKLWCLLFSFSSVLLFHAFPTFLMFIVKCPWALERHYINNSLLLLLLLLLLNCKSSGQMQCSVNVH